MITEVVATEGEGICQGVIVRDVGAVVIAERTFAIGSKKPIHFPVVPFIMNGLPVMVNVTGVMQSKVIGGDRASLTIWLRVAGWYAEFSSFGVVAEIVIEGAVFLAGKHNVFD